MLIRLFLLFSLCIAIPIKALSQQQTSKRASQLINNIPLKAMLDEIPQDLHTQFSQNPFKISDSQNQQMLQLFLQSYKAEALLEDAEKAFNKQYKSTYADSVQRWMQTENTREILNLRNEYYTLQGKRKRVVSKYKFDQNPPSDNRKQVMNRLIDQKNVAQSKIEEKIIVFRSLLKAVDRASSNRSIGSERMKGIVNNFKRQLQRKTSKQLTDKLLVMYRTADSNAVKKYSGFHTTPSGQWFSQAVSTAMQKAYQKASDRFLKTVENM